MAQNQQYEEKMYNAPFRGWNTRAPENLISESDFPYIQNFIIRNNELTSRPALKSMMNFPPEVVSPKNIVSFQDMNNLYHTCCLTDNKLWQLAYNWQDETEPNKQWNLVGSFFEGSPVGNDIYATQQFVQKLFWTNRNPALFYWDGMGQIVKAAPYGARFLGELAFHILLLNVTEVVGGNYTQFPNRVRWSSSGNIDKFDPALDPGAGYNDMLDCPDNITGFMAIGRGGYIFRSNGITEISPTGVGTAPFDFNHLWASDLGIGNILPESIASYGSLGFFISNEDIYQVSIGSFKEIGMGVLNDLTIQIADSVGPVIGTVVPILSRKYIHLMYILTIPMETETFVWVYAVKDQSWTRFRFKGKVLGRPRFVAVK